MQATAAAEMQRTPPDGQKLDVHPQGCSVTHVSVSPDGELFATCGQHGHVALWHNRTSLLVRTLQGCVAGQHVFCHAWSPGGSQLATGDMSGSVTVWEWLQVQSKTPCKAIFMQSHQLHGALMAESSAQARLAERQECGRWPQVTWYRF